MIKDLGEGAGYITDEFSVWPQQNGQWRIQLAQKLSGGVEITLTDNDRQNAIRRGWGIVQEARRIGLKRAKDIMGIGKNVQAETQAVLF